VQWFIKMRKIGKKSQVQMGESIAIIFVFLILISFGSIFYFSVSRGKARVDREETIQLKAIEIAQKASFLPELQCIEINTEDCIDLIKLQKASDVMLNNPIYYYDMFGYSKLTVTRIYPTPEEEWLIYNRTLPLDEYENKNIDIKTTYVPISLYDPTEKVYDFAYLKVETYLT